LDRDLLPLRAADLQAVRYLASILSAISLAALVLPSMIASMCVRSVPMSAKVAPGFKTSAPIFSLNLARIRYAGRVSYLAGLCGI
jgi:hypothetical protein